MKQNILAIFLIISMASYGQGKGTNTITISNVSFDQVVNALLDSGLQIKQIDKDFKTIQTKPYGDYEMSIYVRVKDGTATVTGQFIQARMIFDIAQYYNEYPTGGGINHNKMMVKTFEWMDNFAKSFHTEVSYAKK